MNKGDQGYEAHFFCILVLLLLPSQSVAQEGALRTQEEALQWAREQVGKVHVAGAQCVDLIKAYYDFLGFESKLGDARSYASEVSAPVIK